MDLKDSILIDFIATLPIWTTILDQKFGIKPNSIAIWFKILTQVDSSWMLTIQPTKEKYGHPKSRKSQNLIEVPVSSIQAELSSEIWILMFRLD